MLGDLSLERAERQRTHHSFVTTSRHCKRRFRREGSRLAPTGFRAKLPRALGLPVATPPFSAGELIWADVAPDHDGCVFSCHITSSACSSCVMLMSAPLRCTMRSSSASAGTNGTVALTSLLGRSRLRF